MTMTYYGRTPKGKRIHLGDKLQYATNRETRVDTFCGAAMLAWEEGAMPPPSFREEFCRNCFRSYAWEVMLEKLELLARQIMRDQNQDVRDVGRSRL